MAKKKTTTTTTTTVTTTVTDGKEDLHVYLVLDRTGSMQSIKDKTISGFNEYINGLRIEAEKKGEEVPTFFTLVQFDSDGIDVLYTKKPIAEVPKLNSDTFMPRSMTNLYDAVGFTIGKIESEKFDGRVSLTILTDGQENASREHSSDSIKRKITELQGKGILVSYLGANQDAWAAASAIGISSGLAMNFAAQAVGQTMQSSVASTMRYAKSLDRTVGLTSAHYTKAERDDAVNVKVDTKTTRK